MSKPAGLSRSLLGLVLGLVLGASSAWGALGTSAQSTTSTRADASDFAFKGRFTIEMARGLSETEQPSYSGWYQSSLTVTHVPSRLSANVKIGFAQEYSYEREDASTGSFDNPVLTASKQWVAPDQSEWRVVDWLSVSMVGVLPTGRISERRTFLGAVGPMVMVGRDFRRIGLTQGIGYTRSFFEFDIQDDGSVNAPETFKSVTSIDLLVTEALVVNASFSYAYSVSFQGVGRASEISTLVAEYAFSKNVSGAVGVATERGTLEPDGQTNRIKFYDPNSSMAVLDLIISI